jgi:hypothetical protein
MRTEITINGSSTANNNYITWSPVPCQIRLTDTDGAAAPVSVRLRNNSTNRGGQIIFFSALSGTGQDTLDLTLPIDRTSVNSFIAGKFGSIMNYGAQSQLTTDDTADLKRLYQMVWSGDLTKINRIPIKLMKSFHTTV